MFAVVQNYGNGVDEGGQVESAEVDAPGSSLSLERAQTKIGCQSA